MLVQKSQRVAWSYAATFHSGSAAEAFASEMGTHQDVFLISRVTTTVEYWMFDGGAGEILAKDFEARWIARLQEEKESSVQQPSAGSVEDPDASVVVPDVAPA
jgi:hypothetical protein